MLVRARMRVLASGLRNAVTHFVVSGCLAPSQQASGRRSNAVTAERLSVAAVIMAAVVLTALQAMQQTCWLLYGLLANPVAATTWGRLQLAAPRAKSRSDVLLLSKWVQRRLQVKYDRQGCGAMQSLSRAWAIGQMEFSERKLMPVSAAGISTLYYSCGRHEALLDAYMPAQWHELVALTAASGIRLRLSATPCAPWNVLLPPSYAGPDVQPPAWTELVHRLTALDISVAFPADIAVVCSLAALRHLRMDRPDGADLLLFPAAAAHRAWQWQLSSLRTLQLIRVPPAAFFVPGAAACLQQLHRLRLVRCELPFSTEMLQLQALNQLELIQLQLSMMPDLRGLPALRTLRVYGKDSHPNLDVSRAEYSAELKAALLGNPLGAANSLTEVVLHGIAIPTRECADAMERLPSLKVLGLDFSISDEATCTADALRERMQGRCSVKPASEFVYLSDSGPVFRGKWPDED